MTSRGMRPVRDCSIGSAWEMFSNINRTIRIGTVAATAAIALPAFAADSVDGLWLRPKTGKQVQSYACEGGLGLKVVETGQVIMCGAKAKGGNRYDGTLTSTEDGKQYNGSVTLAADSLKLSGCILGGIICKSETWSRVK
jgi:uncharacterized protein (DUF2147 family)